MNKKYSALTDFQKDLLGVMMQFELPDKLAIKKQLQAAKAKLVSSSDSGSIIKFWLETEEYIKTDNRLIAELEGKDVDGVPIGILLFADEGKVSLLEIYKADGSKIIRMPNPSEFIKPEWKQRDDSTRVRV